MVTLSDPVVSPVVTHSEVDKLVTNLMCKAGSKHCLADLDVEEKSETSFFSLLTGQVAFYVVQCRCLQFSIRKPPSVALVQTKKWGVNKNLHIANLKLTNDKIIVKHFCRSQDIRPGVHYTY